MLKSEQKKFKEKAFTIMTEFLSEAGILILNKKVMGEKMLEIGKLYEAMNKEEEIL
jgi:hypothetical protein